MLGRFIGARGLAFGATVVVLIGLVSWNLLLQNQVQDLQGEVRSAQGQVDDLQAQVKDAQAQARAIQLGGTWADQGANAELASLSDDRSF